jgi:hypothetical protein
MHIFQNLKTPEQFQQEKDKAIAKKRGVTLEEYRALKKKEHEQVASPMPPASQLILSNVPPLYSVTV